MATNTDRRTNLIVATAMLTALTTLTTAFIKIPLPAGYIHLGDTFVVLAAMMLPATYACFSAGVGCALADLIGGYAAWAPWSLLAKIAMVLVLTKELRKYDSWSDISGKPAKAGFVTVLVLAIAANVGVYYFAEGFLYGTWAAALISVPFNLLQSVVGIVLAFVIRRMLPKRINL